MHDRIDETKTGHGVRRGDGIGCSGAGVPNTILVPVRKEASGILDDAQIFTNFFGPPIESEFEFPGLPKKD